MDRDARSVQADMAKVEKEHQQAIESVRRLEGIIRKTENSFFFYRLMNPPTVSIPSSFTFSTH